MAAPALKDVPPLATYEDLKGLPEHQVGEIIGGALIVSPRPGVSHTYAGSSLNALVNRHFGDRLGGPSDPRGWWILAEPELHLQRDVLVPDLAGWRVSRVPTLPDAAFLTVVPDWVCEILSPSTTARDRGDKMSIYARDGVRHLWLVDPVLQTLEVYRLENGHWLVVSFHHGSVGVKAEPFDAVELNMGQWWYIRPEASEASEPAPPSSSP